MKLSDLLATPHELIKPKTNIKASIDIDISYEEAQFVKTVLTTHYSARKIELIPINSNVDIDEYDDTVVFQSVDQIVEAGINSMESAGIDNKMLIEEYRFMYGNNKKSNQHGNQHIRLVLLWVSCEVFGKQYRV